MTEREFSEEAMKAVHRSVEQLDPNRISMVDEPVGVLGTIPHDPVSGMSVLQNMIGDERFNPNLAKSVRIAVKYIRDKYGFMPHDVIIKPSFEDDTILVKSGGGYFDSKPVRYKTNGTKKSPDHLIGTITMSANVEKSMNQSGVTYRKGEYQEMLKTLGIRSTALSLFVAMLLHELGHAYTLYLFFKEDLQENFDILNQHVNTGQRFTFSGLTADDIDPMMWNYIDYDEARADLFMWANMRSVWNIISEEVGINDYI
jgi:hypothetical protein